MKSGGIRLAECRGKVGQLGAGGVDDFIRIQPALARQRSTPSTHTLATMASIRRAATSLRVSSRRGYATPAAQTANFNVSSSNSGIKVATVDEGLPTSAITVAIKAGSRYESQPGLAHVLKNFTFKVGRD